MKRRTAFKKFAVGTGGMIALANQGCSTDDATKKQPLAETKTLKGNINHSVCRWCYSSMPLEALIDASKDMGIQSIEITKPEEWLDDETGLENCAVGLDKIVKHAEKHNVMIAMELLNSKVDHKGYQCDKTPWGVKLVEKLGSPNFKLLYDIYHMQIMEGDVIATIKKYQDYIGHYHTGGVPGRNEIDETQELNYPAIIKAIADTGYKGFLGQEFIPTWEDKMAALKHGVMTCDI